MDPRPIVVIVPMAEEARALREGPFATRRRRTDGSRSAIIEGHRVLLVCSGMGKVRAAAATARALATARPVGILIAGLAGGLVPSLALGDVVVVARAAEHDLDLTPLAPGPAMEPGVASPWWGASPMLVDAAERAARTVRPTRTVVVGAVATGDELVTDHTAKSRVRARLPDALAVDMETAAVAKVAASHQVPWCALRIVSDTADEHFDPAAILNLLEHHLSAELADLVTTLVGCWPPHDVTTPSTSAGG